MSPEEQQALDNRDYWKQFEIGDWQLYGFDYRDRATLINMGTRETVELTEVHVALIRQTQEEARSERWLPIESELIEGVKKTGETILLAK